MTARRYVVSRRSAGLGDLIVNLLVAWRFGKRTGRTLVADWRGTRYLKDPGQNLFGALFEPVDHLAGVPFIGRDDLSDIAYPEPFHPAFWTPALLALPPRRPTSEVFRDRDAALALVLDGADVDAPTVVFDGCINGAVPPPDLCRQVLSELRPVAEIRLEVERFRDRHLSGHPVVAVHLRHGNGGKIGQHAQYWEDFDAAVERCAAATQAVRAQLGGDTAVFLATDAQAAADAFLARIPQTVVRPKFLRRQGEGELHRWPLAFVTRAEAMIDMLLLAESDALVRFPPQSFFSLYAALMKHPPPPRSSPAPEQSSPAPDRDPDDFEPLVVW